MKEVTLVTNSVWNGIAMVITALIVAGASVFCVLQYNKTQWDIANIQKETQIEASRNISHGLDEVGSGICKTSTKSMLFC